MRRRRATRIVRRPGFEALEERSMPAFLAPVDYPSVSPTTVMTGDFNSDSIQDLVRASFSSGSVSVLLGNPDGTFRPPRSSYTGDAAPLWSLAVGDFNEDGNLDLATGSNYDDYAEVGVDDVILLLGHGDGTFALPVYLGTNLAVESIATGDLNGDHNLDLVVTSREILQQQAVTVLLGGGNGTFASIATYGPDTNYLPSPALGDFNGDGNLDLSGGRSLYLGNGDGTFQAPSDVLYYAYYWTTVGDYDGDGKLDLAGINFERIGVLRGNGDGAFQPAQSFAAGPKPGYLNAADINSDGVLDLVLTNYSTDGVDVGVTVLLGNGEGSFAPPITTTVAGEPIFVAVADFNSDGLPDAAAGNGRSNTVSVLLNDGNWPAVGPTLPGDYNRSGAVDAADYVVWRKTLGSSVPNLTAADGNGNGVVDEGDHSVWRANFGETLPIDGAGNLVSAAPAPLTALAQPDERGSVGPLNTSERGAGLATLNSPRQQFIQHGNATMRRLHALPTTEFGMNARANDLLMVLSAAAEFDQHAPDCPRTSLLSDNSTEEAVETRRAALDIALTTLNRAAWQFAGNMLRGVWAGLCAGLVTLALQSWCLAAPQYKLLDLGTFGAFSIANDINEAGQVVGQSRHPDGRIEAFRTQPNCPINPATDGLGHMGGNPPDSYAEAVNDLGQIIGSGWVGFSFQAAFTLSNGLFGPGSDMGGGLNSYGFAINNRGQLVVSANNGADESYIFRTSGLRAIDPATDDLGTLGGRFKNAQGINALGQVVGGSSFSDGATWHAYRTAPDAPINPATDDLGGLGGDYSQALAINDLGQVVGSGTLPNGNEHAFRTSPSAAINPSSDDLGTLGLRSRANDINNSGIVIGNSEVSVEVWHAFVSFPGEPMADLNALLVNPIPGAVLHYANGLNDSGRIVGEMLLRDGTSRAFLLTPVPEPASVFLFGVTLAGISVAPRRGVRRNCVSAGRRGNRHDSVSRRS
jgi:probable HAF family extracellular repeat protein